MRAVLATLLLAIIAVGAWLTRDHWLPVLAGGQEMEAPAPQARAAPARDAPARRADAAPPGEAGAGSARAPGSTATAQDTPAAASAAAQVKAQDTPAAATAAAQVKVQAQAREYVETLTRPEAAPVRVERADHFVTADQVLSLVPQRAVEQTSIAAMRADPSIGAHTPITVVREVEQVERVTPEKLIARSAGNLDAPITVLENDTPRRATVREVLESAKRAPDRPIDLVTHSRYYEQTTVAELAERSSGEPAEPIQVIRGAHGLEMASIGELMQRESLSPDSLFYVRTVRPGDHQGIWGIVHDGIIQTFARGMAIRRGREVNTYQVDIPHDADEREADRSSSFLGKLIHDKTLASYVYNFQHSRMGRNPDRIIPGQEIVIVDFQPEELIEIYKHFVAQRG